MVYGVNASEVLRVTNVATADSGVRGKRPLLAGALGETGAADTPLWRSKVGLDGKDMTISNGLLLIIPNVRNKEVTNMVDTCQSEDDKQFGVCPQLKEVVVQGSESPCKVQHHFLSKIKK